MKINSIITKNYLPKLNHINRSFMPLSLEIKDTVTFSGNSNVQYIDESTPLLDGYEKKPLVNFNKFSPNQLCLVHITNYFPYDGEIKPVNIATKDENGKAEYRSTVHFAINHSVTGHKFGNWQNMNYAIILPMDSVFEQTNDENLLGGRLKDFFIKGCVKLPDSSIIVRHNPDIPKGKLKIINASATVEDFRGTNGIKIVETSDTNIGKAADEVVSKMGYDNLFEAAVRNSGLSYEEYKLLSDESYSTEMQMKDSTGWCKKRRDIPVKKIQDFRALEESGWNNFTKKYNLSNKMHTYSPWGRSEALIECIKLLQIGKDSWIKEFKMPNSSYLDDEDIEQLNNLCKKIEEYPLDEIKNIVEELFGDFVASGIFSADTTVEEIKAKLQEMNPLKNIDYRQEFLKIIDEIKADLPDGKTLGFDIDILKEIIENSKTPSIALKEIEQKLNLRPMVPVDEDVPCDFEIFDMINMLTGITAEQKKIISDNIKATLI